MRILQVGELFREIEGKKCPAILAENALQPLLIGGRFGLPVGKRGDTADVFQKRHGHAEGIRQQIPEHPALGFLLGGIEAAVLLLGGQEADGGGEIIVGPLVHLPRALYDEGGRIEDALQSASVLPEIVQADRVGDGGGACVGDGWGIGIGHGT